MKFITTWQNKYKHSYKENIQWSFYYVLSTLKKYSMKDNTGITKKKKKNK